MASTRRLTDQQEQETRTRIEATRPRRASVTEALRAGKLPPEIDLDRGVVARRMERLGLRRGKSRPGFERVLGESNLVPAATLEREAKVARPIARVRVLDDAGRLVGWGTRFMVSPSLFLTNNHVLRTREEALASRVEFNYQDGLDT